MDELINLLKDPDRSVRDKAVWDLGRSGAADGGKHASQAVSALVGALGDPDSGVRASVCAMLYKLSEHAVTAFPVLVDALGDSSPDVRAQAITAVAQIAKETGKLPAAVPHVLKATKDPDTKVRRFAAQTLGTMETPQAITALIAALKDEDIEVAKVAALSLGGHQKAAKPALPALAEALERKGMVQAVGSAVIAIGAGKEMVPALLKALKDKGARTNIVGALGTLGPEGVAAVPALIELLTDKKNDVRYNAAFALGKIGPGAKAAVPALEAALKDKDRSVREEVNKALTKIRG